MSASVGLSIEKQLIHRQYNEKRIFTDYNRIIRRLQCNHVLSFYNCPIPPDYLDTKNVPVSTCKFSNKYKDVLAVANENGIVCIENIKNVKVLNYYQTHKNTVYDIAWMPGNNMFVTVSGDNSAKLWDCRDTDVNLISTFMGHKRSVRCVSFKPENTAVFATGSRDGTLMIWDARAWRKCTKYSHHVPDQIISCAPGLPSPTVKKNSFTSEFLDCRSVTGLVFQNDNTLISCGSLDKYIRVWDMRKTYSRSTSNTVPKYQLQSPYIGFSYLSMNTYGTRLYASCMDSNIYSFNLSTYDPEPVAAFCGHLNGSFYIKSSVSFDGSYLMSGSSDECAYIWNTDHAELSPEAVKPFVVLNSHTSEVTCVEMNFNKSMVVTCSDDGTFRLWDPYKEKRDDNVVDAAYVDVDCSSAVKTNWKNKRKFTEVEEPYTDSRKVSSGSAHTKICRFYSVNHSTPCICQAKFAVEKTEKRINEESTEEEDSRKRKAIEIEEGTPGHSKQLSVNGEERATHSSQNGKSVRVSSKRKLDMTSELTEEGQKSKKFHCDGLSTPSNAAEGKDTESAESSISEESQNKSSKSFGEEIPKKTSADKSGGIVTLFTTLSSPTSNLPNYVEDGTSPYIHKCTRLIQKENDWLTKLRRTCRMKKKLETRPPSPNIISSISEKRKKPKQYDYTLHRYFKVSSRGKEKSFNAQEVQKRNILTRV